MNNSNPALPLLFSPLGLRNLMLKNRIVSSAHGTGLSDGDRLINDASIAYYEARARGGAGLIVTGATSVHRSDVPKKASLANWDDSVIAPYRKLAKAAHAHGAAVMAQLNHAGALSGAGGETRRVVAPSCVGAELIGETPHPLEPEEIAEIVAAFAAAAARAREAGLDGVELHGAHGNLIQQFLSPLTNRREDQYGGSRENRMRFALEVVAAVRRAVGEAFVVGLRICAEEDYAGGLTVEEMGAVTPALVAAGGLDYINVTSGSDWTEWSKSRHYAPMYTPRLHMLPLARAIRRDAGAPVMAAGRITDPRDAEAVLAAGDADLVAMTRALIADKDLPNKARAGLFDGIRFCVGANEGCLGRRVRGLHITCIQDPTSGREEELGELTTAARRRRVVVVGGGVAGLEAARVAALRGHAVTLLERGPELGGQIRLAARAPGREELTGIAEHLIRAVERLGVEIRLNCEATAETVAALRPDAAILATGSRPCLPALRDDHERLVSVAAALDGAMIGNPVVVYDVKGDIAGLSTADCLARRGYDVAVVTSLEKVGAWIEANTRAVLLDRLRDSGVRIFERTDVVALTDVGIDIRRDLSGPIVSLPDVATVVAACGGAPDNALFHALKVAAPATETHLVGDASAARDIERAIYEGHIAARAL